VSKDAFARDADAFGRRRYTGRWRVWHERGMRQQLVVGQAVGVGAIIAGLTWLVIALF
jgi:hypothetical protein